MQNRDPLTRKPGHKLNELARHLEWAVSPLKSRHARKVWGVNFDFGSVKFNLRRVRDLTSGQRPYTPVWTRLMKTFV